jgi:hypothetical protein
MAVPAPAAAAGSAALYLSPNADWHVAGINFTLQVRENSGAEAVNAVEADFTYDQTKLQYVSADISGGAFPVGPAATGGSGSVAIAAGSTTNRTGDQLVATVTFKPLTSSLGSSSTFSGTSAIVRTSDTTNIWNGNTFAGIYGLNSAAGGGPGSVMNALFWGTDTLAAGQTMIKNQYLLSADGRFALLFQTDGNVVIYGPGMHPLWQTMTGGGGGARMVYQSDGNLVVYSGGNVPLWWSAKGAALAPGGHLTIQNDGNLVLYNGSSAPVWWSGTGGFPPGPTAKGSYQLTTTQTLGNFTYLQSQDKRYALVMQTDCNLVLYGPAFHPIWWSGTNSSNCRLVNQSDGNLVIYNGANVPLWWTAGHGALAPGGHLDLQDDGNLVLYQSGGSPAWFTGTGGQL